jgi:hypothetical protein
MAINILGHLLRAEGGYKTLGFIGPVSFVPRQFQGEGFGLWPTNPVDWWTTRDARISVSDGFKALLSVR